MRYLIFGLAAAALLADSSVAAPRAPAARPTPSDTVAAHAPPAPRPAPLSRARVVAAFRTVDPNVGPAAVEGTASVSPSSPWSPSARLDFWGATEVDTARTSSAPFGYARLDSDGSLMVRFNAQPNSIYLLDCGVFSFSEITYSITRAGSPGQQGSVHAMDGHLLIPILASSNADSISVRLRSNALKPGLDSWTLYGCDILRAGG